MIESAEDTILAACRGDKFRTRGFWGMRIGVQGKPCAVIDLQYTKGGRPNFLASGDTWDAVLAELRRKGELP